MNHFNLSKSVLLCLIITTIFSYSTIEEIAPVKTQITLDENSQGLWNVES